VDTCPPSTRQARGDLKLCNVPEHVRKVLEISHLTPLFDAHESEETAVAAFYLPGARVEAPARIGRSVLCLDCNADVLAYLRELLCRAGYDVHTSSKRGDALLLMRVTRFDLLLAGSDMTSSPATQQGFRAACASVPVIELDCEFSTRDAGEAGAGLLQKIEALFSAKSA
jgi:CheY-like chemotaxis protein